MVPEGVTRDHEVDAIVIGASAGAVDALRVLLPAFPADARTPVLVVVHIPPNRPSLLPEIFGPRCALPVRQPFDKQPIAPGIWLAAPDYHLLVEADRSFAMSLDGAVNFSRPSIDVLFESAAVVYGPRLAAVVLTGASRDGARGARAVRDAGGFVMAQDPADAEVAYMPSAAIEAASPQLVAPLAQLATTLARLSRGQS